MPFENMQMRDRDARAARATDRTAGFTPMPSEHLLLLLDDGDDG